MGRTSDVHRYGRDGAAKILKPETPQHWAAAEAKFTAAVRRLGVPAPAVRDVIDVDGRASVVFERIDGPSMWQRMCERPSDVSALTRELADVQRAIHSAGVPDGVPSLIDRLRLKLLDAGELCDEDRVQAVELLDSLPVGSALLHGDLHPGNILLSANGPIVIDWFDATVGHCAADIARTMLLLRSSGATDLRHLPDSTQRMVAQIHDEYGHSMSLDASYGELAAWCRLGAAGRLAERTDLDPSGLLEMWSAGT